MNTKNQLMQSAGSEYSEDSFFRKITNFALKAGRELIHRSFVLYYTLQDKDTPTWARSVIYGALGYFIMPLDTVPDFTPVVGYSDDLGALIGAMAIVAVHVKDKHKILAEQKLASIFSFKGTQF